MGGPQRPTISVFALGGTIASTTAAGGPGADVALSGEDLVRGLLGVDELADVRVHSLRRVPSGDLRMADVLELASAVRRECESAAHGVVVTQGTDTLEEVAFALDLLLETDKPVVVTGAMRPASLPGADGPANLAAALALAGSPYARGMGALVVFNDEVHAARFVRKRHTTSTATFGSPLTGPIGQVVERRVCIYLRPPGRVAVKLPPQPLEARVALVTIVFDDQGDLLSTGALHTYGGAVIAAYGGGHVPRRIVPQLRELAQRMPVVVASRTFGGEMLQGMYAYPGGELDLRERDLIFAGAYDAVHARMLLQLLLMAGASREAIADVFDRGLTSTEPIVVGSPA